MRMRKGPWLTALLLLASSLSFSHDDLRGTRYVAMEGVDAGDCDHAHDPCRTIAYAIEHAPTGATVKVAEGIFSVEGLSVDDVLHGKTGVLGGYSTADEFKHQDPDLYLTRIYGLQHADRDRLMAHGLRLMVDRVMTRDGRGGGSIGGVSARSEPQAVRAAAANCVQGLAGAFPCRNIDLLAQLRLVDLSTRPNSMSNVWGFVDLDDDREYAVVGVSNATVVIDVTDPENPREVGSVPGNGNAWREVKVFQFFDAAASRHRAYAYITTRALGGRFAGDRAVGCAQQRVAGEHRPGFSNLAHALRLERELRHQCRDSGPAGIPLRGGFQYQRSLRLVSDLRSDRSGQSATCNTRAGRHRLHA